MIKNQYNQTPQPALKTKNCRKNLTKVHETPQDKLNEQLFPKQVGHSATLLIIKTLQIYLFYLFSILNTLNMLKYRCCCHLNITKQKAECVCWGVGGGGGGEQKYKSQILNFFGWVGFGFNGPSIQYFSLYRAVSQREGDRGKKG